MDSDSTGLTSLWHDFLNNHDPKCFGFLLDADETKRFHCTEHGLTVTEATFVL